MSRELVERLRNPERWVDDVDELRLEAANRIEALEEETRLLKESREANRIILWRRETELENEARLHVTAVAREKQLEEALQSILLSEPQLNAHNIARNALRKLGIKET